MKDFNDFIESIDSDSYETIKLAANQSMNITNRNSVLDAAYFISIELLERYHNWLNEN